jgi:RNA polymerase sigma-70 factor (ECF subfamily)
MEQDTLHAELEALHGASFGWAMHCCHGDANRAEDLLQAAYLKVLDGRAKFDGRSAFRTWLFSVIRLTEADERRTLGRRELRLLEFAEDSNPANPPPRPDSATMAAESAARLRTALGQLSSRQQEVLHLVFYQEMTIAEAAGVMGTSLGSARTHYERGKARLREQLAAKPEPR